MKKKQRITFKHITGDECISQTLQEGEQKMFVFFILVQKDVSLDFSIRLRKGSISQVFGIVIGRGNGKATVHIKHHHIGRDSTSETVVTSILYDASRLTFNGFIRTDTGAIKANASQQNNNILLSEKSTIVTNPVLEINEDDINCTHGSATGPVPEKILWYMETRGISRDDAEKLYVSGFVESLASKVPDEKIRQKLYTMVRKYI